MTDEEKKELARKRAREYNKKRNKEFKEMYLANLKKGKYRKGKGISNYENELR